MREQKGDQSRAEGQIEKLGVPIRKEPVHGHATVEIAFFKQGDHRFTHPTPSGQDIVTGIPIEELREKLGGNEGDMVGPTGETHRISIPPDLPNGQGVMVALTFRFVDPGRDG